MRDQNVAKKLCARDLPRGRCPVGRAPAPDRRGQDKTEEDSAQGRDDPPPHQFLGDPKCRVDDEPTRPHGNDGMTHSLAPHDEEDQPGSLANELGGLITLRALRQSKQSRKDEKKEHPSVASALSGKKTRRNDRGTEDQPYP